MTLENLPWSNISSKKSLQKQCDYGSFGVYLPMERVQMESEFQFVTKYKNIFLVCEFQNVQDQVKLIFYQLI